MTEAVGPNDEESMDSAKCLCLLEDLYGNRTSRAWPALSSGLTSVLLSATTDINTWKRENSVTKSVAETIIGLIMRITHEISCRVCLDDIEYVQFSPSQLLSEVTICRNFVRICYRAFVKEAMQTYVLPFDLTYNDNIAKITAKMTISSIFGKRPQCKSTESPLWSKLEEIDSSRSLFTATSVWTCGGGCGEYLEEKGNFAIVDSCFHLFCIGCAKKNFDVVGYMKR